jgi:hypothetical protein
LNVLNPDRLVPEYQGELGMYKAVLTLKKNEKKSFCPRAREKTRNVQSGINGALIPECRL